MLLHPSPNNQYSTELLPPELDTSLRAWNFSSTLDCVSPTMLSRKPTAIKLTQEDIQDYDNLIAQQQQQEHSPEADIPSQPAKGAKGKESTAPAGVTAQERQRDMDERIGVGGAAAAGRGGRR